MAASLTENLVDLRRAGGRPAQERITQSQDGFREQYKGHVYDYHIRQQKVVLQSAPAFGGTYHLELPLFNNLTTSGMFLQIPLP